MELADAEGSRPVAWAHFVMPNAQDGGMRDAGFPIENIPEYIEVSGGLQDSITKRVWRVPVETDKIAMTFKAAQDVCAKAVGWRVPTRIELVSLLDFSDPRPGQKRLSAKFGDPGREPYWTTSELRTTSSARTGENWAVQFGTGTLPRISTATGQAAVLCVKGGGS